jgi:site-specific recombinase XerD
MKYGKLTSKSTKATKKKDALKFLNNFKIEQQEVILKKPISLSKFKTEYEQFVQTSFSKSYLRNVRSSLTQFLKYTGDMQLDEISLRVLEAFLLFIFSRSKHSAFLCYRNLRAAFNKAIEWDYLVDNPFRKFRFPKLPKVYPAFISEAEFVKILENVKTSLLKDVYVTLFHTGMRAGELINLKWNDVDLESRIISIRNTIEFSTKGKKDRIIPINDKLLRVMQKHFPKMINLNKPQFVFERIPGFRLTIDYLSKHFKKAVRAAKMNDQIHLHTLRHSFASNLIQKGVSLYVIKELLGHEDFKTTQMYSHLQHQNLADAVNLL